VNARARVATVVAALTALLLGACSAIPTEGPVNEGSGVVATSPPFVPIAEGPRLGDGPTAIVSGFVAASSAGFASDFSVAREYLTGSAAISWDPYARVTVFDSGALNPEYTEETSTVTYDVPVMATLDADGRMTEAADGFRETLEFTMGQNADGEWRITGLDDGTILAAASFDRGFLSVSLIFASVDATTEVPELRWLPVEKASTLAARELVEGPSETLANAVRTGFPAGSRLAVDSVVVTGGVAAVQLTPESAGTPGERALAEQQMQATLRQIPGVAEVEVTVGGVPIGGDASAALKPEPLPGSNGAALVQGRLGLWDGENMWATPDSAGGVPAESRGLAQGYGSPIAAWVVGGVRVVTSDALRGGTAQLEPHNVDVDPPSELMEVSTVMEGNGLIAPSMDRHGWIWSAESADPSLLRAVTSTGESVSLEVPTLRGSTIQAMAISSDGARVAILSRNGGTQTLEVSAVVRDDDGTPLSIGEPLAVGADLSSAIDLSWIDPLRIAVLGESDGDAASAMWIAHVGGLTTAATAVRGSVSITARQGERSLVVVDDAGAVYIRAGSGWSQVSSGASEVAYSG
jgi:hypothetical protein